jgi:hypothetical protein
MKKLFRLFTATAATVMLVAAPAAAATSTFHARTTQMAVVGLSFDRGVVAANCPAGFAERGGAFLTTQETVHVDSEVFSGTLHSVSDQHCSVPRPPMSTWIDGTRKVTPIELEAGHMVLATEYGDQLVLDYRAPGVIKGDLLGVNTHTFNGSYTVTGGTGIFAGATGHGNVSGEVQATATGFTGGWTMHGTISVPD